MRVVYLKVPESELGLWADIVLEYCMFIGPERYQLKLDFLATIFIASKPFLHMLP